MEALCREIAAARNMAADRAAEGRAAGNPSPAGKTGENRTEERDRKVSSVFLGGGTPSLLTPRQIDRVFDALYQSFSLTPDAEITMEANPGTLDEERLRAMKEAGVNRLSLGLQSTEDTLLRILGRIHTWRDFRESWDLVRKHGFDNVNIDLMFALPEQTREIWQNTLRTAAAMSPEHLSCYSLILEEGTPFAAQELRLPDEETEYEMYEDTSEILSAYGYRQYEISNYAREGRACRHNIGYWIRREYLGLGLGASSLWENERFSNTRDLKQYLEWDWEHDRYADTLREERIPLSREEAMAEFMILGLRMTEGVSCRAFLEEFGRTPESLYAEILEKYRKLGLLVCSKDRIALTRPGIHVSNRIMAEFL